MEHPLPNHNNVNRQSNSNLNLVGELFDFIDSGVVLVGEHLQLPLVPVRHLLQVGALVFCVTEGALRTSHNRHTHWGFKRSAPPTCLATEASYLHLRQLPHHLDLLLQDSPQGLLGCCLVVVLVLLQGQELLADALLRLRLSGETE